MDDTDATLLGSFMLGGFFSVEAFRATDGCIAVAFPWCSRSRCLHIDVYSSYMHINVCAMVIRGTNMLFSFLNRLEFFVCFCLHRLNPFAICLPPSFLLALGC